MRRAFFFPRLAWTNLRKNRTVCLPYILTCTLSVLLFFILLSITLNPSVQAMKGGGSLTVILLFGVVIMAVLCTLFLLYTNSFLMKRRKKELALYGVLGLEKRHIGRILFYEALETFAVSLTVGVLLGMAFGNLLFRLLLNITRLPITIGFPLSPAALGGMAAVFAVLFLLIFLRSLAQLRTADPIRLLQEEKQGETEPKARPVLAAAGILALAGGYGLAVSVRKASDVLGIFLLAVLLVIIGTYCLFTAGSIAMLKLLKRRRRFYYRAKNFVAVSGLLYRMRRNASGLSAICILSTMVMVTVSSTTALYFGQQDILAEKYPLGLTVSCEDTPESRGRAEEILTEAAGASGVTLEEPFFYSQMTYGMARMEDAFTLTGEGRAAVCSFMTRSDLEELAGPLNFPDLREGELYLLYAQGVEPLSGGTVSVESETFLLAGQQEYLLPRFTRGGYLFVAADVQDYTRLMFALGQQNDIRAGVWACEPVGSDADITAFAGAAALRLEKEAPSARITSCRAQAAQEFYSLYGGLLFLGIFFGILFLAATVLILYYKQITEGYEDRERFLIMQKVGMDARMVRAAIRRQILLVFFLPLFLAVVHMGFAYTILPKMLVLFGMSNRMLMLLCTAATVLLFAGVYTVFYSLTARTYYRLVERRI